MTEYIVFDVGNVLIRWDPRLVYRDDFASDAEIDAFLEEIGFAAWNIEQDRGRSWADGVALAVAAHPHRRPLIEKFDREWHKAVPGPIEGTVAILEALKSGPLPVYAITNYSAEKWAESRQRFAFLASGFQDVVVSAHVGLLKPDPAIFELFLTRNGLTAQDGIFIDDSPANVATARSLGFDAILFDDPEALGQALRDRNVLRTVPSPLGGEG